MNSTVEELASIADEFIEDNGIPEVDWTKMRSIEFQDALKTRRSLVKQQKRNDPTSYEHFESQVRIILSYPLRCSAPSKLGSTFPSSSTSCCMQRRWSKQRLPSSSLRCRTRTSSCSPTTSNESKFSSSSNLSPTILLSSLKVGWRARSVS